MKWWSELGKAEQWGVAGLVLGLALIVLFFVLHALYEICYYGPRAYLRHAVRMDAEGWRLIGILLFLAMAAAMVFTQVV